MEDRQLLSTCHVIRLGDTGGGFGLRGDFRYCINKANDLPGPDAIDFRVTGTIGLASALPDLEDELDIVGPGADQLTIDAQQKARAIYVEEGAVVFIRHLTFSGGSDLLDGGGVYNEGDLTLEDCVVSNNTVYGDAFEPHRGAGIYNEGHLFLMQTSVLNNVSHSLYDWGGGIYNAQGASLSVEDSEISDNLIGGSFSATPRGAGLYNVGTATLFQSTISRNEANRVEIDTLRGYGGGIYNVGQLLIDSSLISENEVSGDYYAVGGGLSNEGGMATVINTTIHGNLAFSRGDTFGESRGGGISSEGGTVMVHHSTIAKNRSGGLETYVLGYGGGIFLDQFKSSVQVHNSIIADNNAKTNGQDLSGNLLGSGHNLFSNGQGGGGYVSTDILNVSAKLGPLADNGGPTQTMALLPGSPAIDAGDNTDAPEWDQRGPGFPRIVNGTIDIGAYEVQLPPAPSRPAVSLRHEPNLLPLVLGTAELDTLEYY